MCNKNFFRGLREQLGIKDIDDDIWCVGEDVWKDCEKIRVSDVRIYNQLPKGTHVMTKLISGALFTNMVDYKVVDLCNATLYSYYKEGLKKHAELLPTFVVRVVDLCRLEMRYSNVVNIIFEIVNNINISDSGFDLKVVVLINNNTLNTLQDNRVLIDKSYKVTLFVDLLDWTNIFQSKRMEKLFELDDSKKKVEDRLKCNITFKSCNKDNFIVG